MDLISARNASAEIPTIRNGIDKSHTIGHNTSANSAIGQHSTNRIAHNNNVTNTLIVYLLKNQSAPTIIITRSKNKNQHIQFTPLLCSQKLRLTYGTIDT